jgi:hypothetical protein
VNIQECAHTMPGPMTEIQPSPAKHTNIGTSIPLSSRTYTPYSRTSKAPFSRTRRWNDQWFLSETLPAKWVQATPTFHTGNSARQRHEITTAAIAM